ncbi:MAG: hypothetical protein ACRDRX_18400 [Pseudonocardiaceae bacterium]
MARYCVRYVSYAEEQLSRLPRALRTEFDARVEDLARDPYAVGDYDKGTNSYTATFGGGTGIVGVRRLRRDRYGDDHPRQLGQVVSLLMPER